MLPDFKTETVLGYTFSLETAEAIVGAMIGWIGRGAKPKTVMCGNPHSLVVASDNSAFKSALDSADWLLPDGVGILYASRLASGKIQRRITGYDIFSGLMAAMNEAESMSCFFLGSSESTLSKIAARMSRDYPNVELAGTYSPPFKTEFDNRDIAEMLGVIERARPDVLWVGLTAPKQELLIDQYLVRTNAKVIGAIGAVFDYYAGTIRRSGPLVRKFGLEWLVRLLREPRRLWHRTFVSASRFGWMCLRYRFPFRAK